MEGHTARDALMMMRADLRHDLRELDAEIAEIDEMLELGGIAGQMLGDDPSVHAYPAIRRWLEAVSDVTGLQRDREDLVAEREEIIAALQHLEERLYGAAGG